MSDKRDDLLKVVKKESGVRKLGKSLDFISANLVEDTKIDWLWENRIAKAALCMIGGVPGVGKSQFSSWLAAQISKGGKFPDGSKCPTGSVAILNEEDDLGYTQKSRLKANSADLSKILLIEGAADVNRRYVQINLAQDLDILESFIIDTPDLQALIIDPITSYMGDVNANSNTDVRNFFYGLIKLAKDYNFALICLTHLNKSQSQDIHGKMIGSTAFSALSRSAYLISEDPNDTSRRYIVPIKNNLGDSRTGFVYKIVEDKLTRATKVEFLNEKVTKTAGELLFETVQPERRSNLENAKELLNELLENGPVRASLIEKAARSQDVPFWSIREARKILNLQSRNIGFGKDKYTEWFK